MTRSLILDPNRLMKNIYIYIYISIYLYIYISIYRYIDIYIYSVSETFHFFALCIHLHSLQSDRVTLK